MSIDLNRGQANVTKTYESRNDSVGPEGYKRNSEPGEK